MREPKFKVGDLVRMSRSLVPYGPYGAPNIGVVIEVSSDPPLYDRYYVQWNLHDVRDGTAMWYASQHLEKIA